MKKIPVIIFALLILSLPAHAENVTSILSECSENHTHTEINECVSSRASESEAALKEAEDNVIKRLSLREEEPEDIKRAENAFKGSNKSFREYRKKNCDFYNTTTFGGNGAHDIEAACITVLNNKHAEELREMAGQIGE